MDDHEREYHLAREQQERRAANAATCPQAQSAHSEMASLHATMAQLYADWAAVPQPIMAGARG